MYGYLTTSAAVRFCGDLKLAHYTKIPPRHTFAVQIVATLVSTFVAVSIFNFQMSFDGVCTNKAAFKMSCAGSTSFNWGVSCSPLTLRSQHVLHRRCLLGYHWSRQALRRQWAVQGPPRWSSRWLPSAHQ